MKDIDREAPPDWEREPSEIYRVKVWYEREIEVCADNDQEAEELALIILEDEIALGEFDTTKFELSAEWDMANPDAYFYNEDEEEDE